MSDVPNVTFMNTNMMSWNDAITEYTTALRQAGRSTGTVKLHRHYLTLASGRVLRPWGATTKRLTAVLDVPHWSPETRKSARGVLVAFYRWGVLAGYIGHNPAERLMTVTVPAGVPRPTPENVLARALALSGERERLMLLLAAYGGLRCSEIATVHTDRLVGRILFVTGKGGKTRRVPILRDDLLHAIRTADGWLFPGRLDGHLAAGTVTRLLSEALPGKWTGHTLRHRFASRSFANGTDLYTVGELLGHVKLDTTKRYTQMPDDKLLAGVAAAAA